MERLKRSKNPCLFGERRAVFVREYSAGTAKHCILELLTRLPGPPVGSADYYKAAGVVRVPRPGLVSDGGGVKVSRPVSPPTDDPQPAPMHPPAVETIDAVAAAGWARANKVALVGTSAEIVRAINVKRQEFGLTLWRVVPARPHHTKLPQPSIGRAPTNDFRKPGASVGG